LSIDLRPDVAPLTSSALAGLAGRRFYAGQLRAGDDVLDALQPGDTILAATAE